MFSKNCALAFFWDIFTSSSSSSCGSTSSFRLTFSTSLFSSFTSSSEIALDLTGSVIGFASSFTFLCPTNLVIDFLNLLLKLVLRSNPPLGSVPALFTSSSFFLKVAGSVLVLLKVSDDSSPTQSRVFSPFKVLENFVPISFFSANLVYWVRVLSASVLALVLALC